MSMATMTELSDSSVFEILERISKISNLVKHELTNNFKFPKEILVISNNDENKDAVDQLEDNFILLIESYNTKYEQQNDDYFLLERQVQKYEREIRSHIKNEQQLSVFNDELQQDIIDCEKKMDQQQKEKKFQKIQNKYTIALKKLEEETSKLSEENLQLRIKIEEIQKEKEQQYQIIQQQNEKIKSLNYQISLTLSDSRLFPLSTTSNSLKIGTPNKQHFFRNSTDLTGSLKSLTVVEKILNKQNQQQQQQMIIRRSSNIFNQLSLRKMLDHNMSISDKTLLPALREIQKSEPLQKFKNIPASKRQKSQIFN